ncbi:MAG: acetaldehyde dehydrogenase (acetylating) [Flavobacteriaceae bacterium]|nr:acetaldehyde dehydrogenase (acetylating) [Flavobacteriaceae bacterium]
MIRAGIIGTGNIGTDLLLKLIKTDFINLVIFSGRRLNSNGMKVAKKNNIEITDTGIQFFIDNPNFCDVIYDCTNAFDAKKHARIFDKQQIKVIDLTPAKVGAFSVPSLNIPINEMNINMITCGGQASIPLLHSISKHCDKLSYIEVVSQIASDSAGMATRLNIDNYIETTENAIFQFTGTEKCKVILNLNPAIPQVDMQTTMFVKANSFDFEPLVGNIYEKIMDLRKYISHYELVMPPTINNNILVLSVRVKGAGDYLPKYAGNLDIINCAAIEATKKMYE